jgi:hypothetical protein
MAGLVADGKPASISQRGGRGHRLVGRGGVVSSGGGRGSEGGLRERSEWLVCVAALGSSWRWPARVEDLLVAVGVRSGTWAPRGGDAGTRGAVLDGYRSMLGAKANGERQSRLCERMTVVVGRGGNGLLLRTDSDRIRRTGRRLHALCVEVSFR